MLANMSVAIAICAPNTGGASGGISRFETWKIVSCALFHQASALDRVESSTTASGFAAASSRQNAHAGQSTVATNSARNPSQSGSVPLTAACHTAMSSGRPNVSPMW